MQGTGEPSDNPVGINITAMVDVIFCLCLFFMCSFHFKQLEGKLDMWLPREKGNFSGEALVCKDEIRVTLRWDPQTGSTRRAIRGYDPVADDREFLGQILEMSNRYRAEGVTDAPLIIDCDDQVPWQEAVRVLDLAKEAHIERIELAAPAVPPT